MMPNVSLNTFYSFSDKNLFNKIDSSTMRQSKQRDESRKLDFEEKNYSFEKLISLVLNALKNIDSRHDCYISSPARFSRG